MATVKVSSSKTCASAINYAKNKAVVMDGLNVDPKYAIGQMEQVRQVFNKTDGVQAHVFIQSFAPGEVTPQQACDLGLELAKAISEDKQYQVAVYTHNDTNHIHNHLILNSVDFETGLKYQQSFDVKRVRDLSDTICKENGLSVIQEQQVDKKPIAEIKAEENGHYIWKNDLRERISSALENSTSTGVSELRKNLALEGVDVRYRGNGISYSFIDLDGKQRISRGSKLGAAYDKESVRHHFKQNRKPQLSQNAQEQIERLTREWNRWEDNINQGIALEYEINQELKVLIPQYDSLDKQIDQLKLDPIYVKFNQLTKQHQSEVNQEEKGKEEFLKTKNRNIFKKAESYIEWKNHSSTLKESTVLAGIEKIKPQKQQIDQQISVLAQSRANIWKNISSLKETRDNDLNIKHRNHYRGHQRRLAYEIDCWKSPDHEQHLKEREIAYRMEQSRGISR
ncbi:relaxase/mobilization nuclease domain-containing protein [Vagococcus fluvialis]|uniref:relaxase/mobilization nuclease domain-containing protein n=1 Tax=Vagococcus fluvialis TaxID=2738 RepID=UPI001D09A698|nr:relaxase/mobilization nuclease domain-containing protein [Vagococcus fluvialis]UDM81167.1 relaxase/mobilization nuclease domain-containing protein [Vagococcus fluvialis]